MNQHLKNAKDEAIWHAPGFLYFVKPNKGITNMRTSKNNLPNKKQKWRNFDSLGSKLIATFALIGSGFTAGMYFESNIYDKEKLELAEKNQDLQIKIARLNSKLYIDSIEKRNWIIQNTTRVIFNNTLDTMNKLAFLTIANSSIGDCEDGHITGCWKKEAIGKATDIISVQIFYKNDGDFPVSNLSTGFNIYPISDRHVIISAGLKSGNQLIYKDAVSLVLTEPCKIDLNSTPGKWYKNADPEKINIPERINSEILITNSGLNIGTVNVREYGNIIFFLKLSRKP